MSATVECQCEYCNASRDGEGPDAPLLFFISDRPLVAQINRSGWMWTESILGPKRFANHAIRTTDH